MPGTIVVTSSSRYGPLLILILLACTAGAACTMIPGHTDPGTPAAPTPAGDASAYAGQQEIPVYRFEVTGIYPHDPGAFTEGLAYDRGFLVESSGLPGNGTLRRTNLTTGEILAIRHLPADIFAEGAAVMGTTVVQLDGNSGTGMLYDADTLDTAGTFRFAGTGWGITHDDRYLILSNGTPVLTYIDPQTFRPVRIITVTARGRPVGNLNELEYVDGEIYANIFPSDMIVRISPETGNVTGLIDLSGLLSPDLKERAGDASTDYFRQAIPPEAFAAETCTNGIAWDPEGGRLFVTGKLWPVLFGIRLVPV